jgi:hypothetical protein
MNKTERAIRAIARMLSAAILIFWGYFLIAHLVGEEGRATRPLEKSEYLGLAAILTSLAGLALAWKWEFAGAALALIAFAIGAVISWRLLVSPYVLIPLDAILFLSLGWIRKAPAGLAAYRSTQSYK